MSANSATAASSAEAGSSRQRLGGLVVLRAAPAAAGGRAGRPRQGVFGRPGDRPAGLGGQLGAQRDLQVGEPVVAERLREPQHRRRADLGAFGKPGGADQPGARDSRRAAPGPPVAPPGSASAARRRRARPRSPSVHPCGVPAINPIRGHAAISTSRASRLRRRTPAAVAANSRSPKPVDPITRCRSVGPGQPQGEVVLEVLGGQLAPR